MPYYYENTSNNTENTPVQTFLQEYYHEGKFLTKSEKNNLFESVPHYSLKM